MAKCIVNSNYKLSSDISTVSKYCEEFKHVLKDEERLYLTRFDYKLSNFYANPKIHKSNELAESIKSCNNVYTKVPIPNDFSFRFITAGINSPLSRLSEFLHLILKPFVPLAPSYIRDSTDFLVKKRVIINDPVELDDIVFEVCDVKDMYPNIELPVGLESTSFFIDSRPDLLNGRITKDCILKGLARVMSCCTFQFNDRCYSRETGTATGTTVAPTYANLVMAFLETKLYAKVLEVFGEEVQKYVIKNWLRFLDDGIIFWKKSFGDFSLFMQILNSLHPSIQFTHESSERKVSFLNITLYKENNSLKTDVFYKKTDSHDYLPFGSCHPRHTKQNIPYTLARLICTIVDDPLRKLYRLQELKCWLLASGYDEGIIDSKFDMLKNIDQNILRTKVSREREKQPLCFVQTRNSANPHVFEQLRKFVGYLKTDER